MLKQILLLLFLVAGAAACKPRCPIESCHVRMVHRHGPQEFRGERWYKKQNKKYGEKYKEPSSEKPVQHNNKSQKKK